MTNPYKHAYGELFSGLMSFTNDVIAKANALSESHLHPLLSYLDFITIKNQLND